LSFTTKTKTTATTTTTPTTTAAGTRNISPIFDRKIDETTEGLSSFYVKNLRSIDAMNGAIIVDYISALKIEVNLSDHYRKNIIELLCRFAKHNKNKPFKDITRLLIRSISFKMVTYIYYNSSVEINTISGVFDPFHFLQNGYIHILQFKRGNQYHFRCF
jgi:hypothetical protein